MKLSDLEVKAYLVRREVMQLPHPYTPEVAIARYRQREGPDKWVVQSNSNVLNKDGEWEWEPRPSSRDDAYLARCRFDTAEEALAAYIKFEGGPNG